MITDPSTGTPTHHQPSATAQPSLARRIVTRFAGLIVAEVVGAAASVVFLFWYLPRMGETVYGEIMYAMAAGGILAKVVQFGLYYPLVVDLGEAEHEQAPQLINPVNLIKVALFVPSVVVLGGVAFFQDFSFRAAAILFAVSVGAGFEAVAETFFADLRVRGLQSREALIRGTGSVLSYVFGLATAAMGLHPVIVAMFRLVSGLVWVIWGAVEYLRAYTTKLFSHSDPGPVWHVFRQATVFAFIEILGIVYNQTNIFFLKSTAGFEGVAYYKATHNIVDSVSVLASEHLLAWVVFPLLSTLWWKQREEVPILVRGTARWLLVISFPIMFVLAVESELIIGSVFPPEFRDAVWMQKYLVWTIVLSFVHNLFAYIMMVAGGARILLGFAVATTVVNLLLNIFLVPAYGLAGGCLVLVFSKLLMTILSFAYCQVRFGFFRAGDLLIPLGLAAVAGLFYVAAHELLGLHAAVTLTMVFYGIILWNPGLRYLGQFPGKTGGSA